MLLEHVTGEAADLLEAIPMTELTKEDGYVKVFKAMDEKYKDLKQDEMHKALREYF